MSGPMSWLDVAWLIQTRYGRRAFVAKASGKCCKRGSETIPALSCYSPFYMTNSLRKKKTMMTFSTPFTCTEIIAHVRTLKYFALASKISVGAEDKCQNLLILWEKLAVSEWPKCLIPGFTMAAHNTVFYFCMFHFLFVLACRWEKNLII